jgi:hypothetical protein
MTISYHTKYYFSLMAAGLLCVTLAVMGFRCDSPDFIAQTQLPTRHCYNLFCGTIACVLLGLIIRKRHTRMSGTADPMPIPISKLTMMIAAYTIAGSISCFLLTNPPGVCNTLAVVTLAVSILLIFFTLLVQAIRYEHQAEGS